MFFGNHDNDKLVLKDITLVDAPGAISGAGGRNDKVAPRARSADMVTVRHNTITLCGWHSLEAGQVAAASERIRIEDNRIRDSKQAGILLQNVHGALLRGNTFESVTTYFAPTNTYQTVILKDCTDIRESGEILHDQRARSPLLPSRP